MIGRILAPANSSKRILDYNEKKVAAGDASVVAIGNLPADDMATIYDTLEEYEANPAIAEQFKKKSFHWTLGPGATDKISKSEEDCIACIREVMDEMGYGEQPYVVYRHNDIDRPHYHIVSTRVQKNGKSIDNHNEGKKMSAVLKKLAPKYGYTVGIDKEILKSDKLPAVALKEFSYKDTGNIIVGLKTLFDEALRYDFHSIYQFQAIMQTMNVRMTLRRRKDGGSNVILQGLKDDGKRMTRLYSMEKTMDVPGGQMYASRLAENNELGIIQSDRKIALKTISDYCMENTDSLHDYCCALEEAGVRHVVVRDDTTDAIKRITLVEKNTYSIVDTAVRGELFLKDYTDAEKSGRWKGPSKRTKRPIPGAKVRKQNGPVFFTPERTVELKERITRAIAQYRGVPVPGHAIGQGGPKLVR